ncbi:MAG: cell shape-determining protein, partial [Salegentibacter sp.]
HYDGLIEITKTDPDIIPIFVKDNEGNLEIIPSNSKEMEIGEEYQLVYLGKELEAAKIAASREKKEEKETLEENSK